MGKRFTLDLPADVRAFYRDAAARRRREPRPCAVCGRSVVATPRRQYCSAACSQRAYRARHRPPPAALAPPPAAQPFVEGERVRLLADFQGIPDATRGRVRAPLPNGWAAVEFALAGAPLGQRLRRVPPELLQRT